MVGSQHLYRHLTVIQFAHCIKHEFKIQLKIFSIGQKAGAGIGGTVDEAGLKFLTLSIP